MPGAQCTRSLVCAGVVKYAHEYSQRRHRKHPAFPTQWFYGLYVISPVTGLFCHRRSRGIVSHENLAPASGRQDHTTSPSATSAARLASPPRPPHPMPNVRDDRDTPLLIGPGRCEHYN
jgi:hypothetical protein